MLCWFTLISRIFEFSIPSVVSLEFSSSDLLVVVSVLTFCFVEDLADELCCLLPLVLQSHVPPVDYAHFQPSPFSQIILAYRLKFIVCQVENTEAL